MSKVGSKSTFSYYYGILNRIFASHRSDIGPFMNFPVPRSWQMDSCHACFTGRERSLEYFPSGEGAKSVAYEYAGTWGRGLDES